jgi:ABC-2 type transport system permease protein
VPSDVTATGLVYTIDRAWGETNFDELNNNQVKYDQGADIAGPVLLAAALSNTKTSARIVVFGDADFAQDSLFNQYGNGDMFINAVDWAAQQENIISLTPKQPIDRQYTPPGTFSLVLILIGTVCLLPLLIVAGGVGAWWTRRRRG